MTSGRDNEEPGNRRENRAGSGAANDLQQAVERFEQVVEELVGSATSEFSGRATSFLNETTAKIEREFSSFGSRSSSIETANPLLEWLPGAELEPAIDPNVFSNAVPGFVEMTTTPRSSGSVRVLLIITVWKHGWFDVLP